MVSPCNSLYVTSFHQDEQSTTKAERLVAQHDADDGMSKLADELVRFNRLASRAKSTLHTGDLGAEFSALLLLFPLQHLGPMRVTDLAEVKQADPSTISRQAAQLVKAGLARREADPADGRATRLAVTPAGEVACQRLHAVRRTMLSEALNDWPSERVAVFADLFHHFNSCVEAHLRHDPTSAASLPSAPVKPGIGAYDAASPRESV
jgi:DNA-binding MarR family transcriptional regulator